MRWCRSSRKAGFRWMATDEEILARTTGRYFTRDGQGQVEHPDALYRPYRVGRAGEDVACGFRDHTLSDLIGFTYASWSADGAADDFVRRLEDAGRRASPRMHGVDPTIFVILDGENAWEHYEGQGRPFLRALYRRLGSSSELRTVTMDEACANAAERLPSIFPGSWINGDYYIWIGHADDHRAWGQLADARTALASASSSLPPESLARAREEMFVAEGSDWFWWYGDDHSSDHDRDFDELFRRHVQNVYRALELPIPEELLVSNITTQPSEVQVEPPTGFVQPVIDGEITSYFEWIGAGSVEVSNTAGSMHQVSEQAPGIRAIEFGFDLANLYVRVSGDGPIQDVVSGGLTLSVNFIVPAGVRAVVGASGSGHRITMVRRNTSGAVQEHMCRGAEAAVGRVAELKVPFECLGLEAGARMAFLVALSRGATEVQHHPQLRPIELNVPDVRFAASHWTA